MIKLIKALLVVIMLPAISNAQGYIFNKEKTCKIFTNVNNDIRSFTYSGGQCKGGYLDGNARIKMFENGSLIFTINANYVRGMINGKGIIEFSDGEKRDGVFIDNRMVSGSYRFKTGSVFTGTYEDGSPKKGTMKYPDGRIVKGYYQFGSFVEEEDISQSASVTTSKEANKSFTEAEDAITYLNDNFLVTTERKQGKTWVDILGISFDENDYFTIRAKGTGKVSEDVLREKDEEAIVSKVTMVEDFKPIGIRWNKVGQVKIEKDANGDSWVVISGPVEVIENNKLIANRLRLYVWPEKKENIKNAIMFLASNMDNKVQMEAQKQAQAERQELAEAEREKQLKIQEERAFENYRFTSLNEAAAYLEKVLGCSTSHLRPVKSVCRIPGLNQYMVIDANGEGFQSRYFVFTSITSIGETAETESACPSCGENPIIKVTVPVYWYDTHELNRSEYYFAVNDRGASKAVKALRYLRANSSFGEPTAKNSTVSNTPSQQSNMYEVYFSNNTDIDIYVAYSNDVDGDGSSEKHYWYKFSPGETSILFRAKSRAFCFYAYGRTKGGKIRYWNNGGGYDMVIDGVTKPAGCKAIPEGQYRYTVGIN